MVREVTVGDRTIRFDDFSGRKAIRVLRTLDEIAKAAPALQQKWQEYTKRYEADNTTDVDRVYARVEFAPRPLYTEDPVIGEDGQALLGQDGQPLVRRTPMIDENGAVRMGPDPLGHITEEDWQASGNKLKRPRTPSVQEQVMAIFPDVIDMAEAETIRLLGLVCMPNSDIKKYRDGDELRKKINELGEDLLDAPFDQLAELMIVAGEVIQDQYRERIVGKLADRANSVLGLFGIQLVRTKKTEEEVSTSESETTKPTSSTASPEPTAGESDASSTALAGAASGS